MTATRETFANLATWEVVVWYALAALDVAVFAAGVALLVRRYRRGRWAGTPFSVAGALRAARAVASHARLRRDPVAGLAHAAIFYGFLVLFAGTAILAIQDDVARPLFGFDFWRGSFYLGYSLFLDLFGAALVVGLVPMALRRARRRPRRLVYRAPPAGGRVSYALGDWALLGALLFLGVTGFLLEALRIAELNPSFETWSPVGWLVGHGFRDLGLRGVAAEQAHHGLWWAHGVVALAFVAAIPFTKAAHMIVAPAALAAGDPDAGRRLPPAASGAPIGYERLGDFTSAHLLSLDACTRCGRCEAVCPATAAGYPLSPRDLVLSLGGHAGDGPVVGEALAAPVVWSCTQCLACVEACPVGIEHVPIINQLRRALVERGELDNQLQGALESVATSGNSLGEPRRKRPRWTRELDFEVKDARKEPAELLWFVGDHAALDARNQGATRSLARILHDVDVDYGILFEAEQTAGCDVRRAGEEGLFAALAAANVETISSCSFDRIFSSDPHTFHTLKNEYPDFGGSWPVLHHSQLLLELIESGRIAPRPLGYRVTYHDPCTLGRYNGVYEEPRRVLRALGLELVELPRNRGNALCCGAGGGRIWMAETERASGPRASEQRIEEALALGALDYFVVACPKDVIMYEDAIRTSGHEGEIAVRELSELVLEALPDLT